MTVLEKAPAKEAVVASLHRTTTLAMVEGGIRRWSKEEGLTLTSAPRTPLTNAIEVTTDATDVRQPRSHISANADRIPRHWWIITCDFLKYWKITRMI